MSDETPKERKLTAYERWELPNLESKQSDLPRKQASGLVIKSEEAIEVSDDIDEEELVYEPLTAQQLDEIRSAAYEEGFTQGQEEGFQKGYDEGLVKGQEDGYLEGLDKGQEQGRSEAQAQGIELAQTQLAELEQLLNAVVKEFEQPLEASRAAMESLLNTTIKRLVEHVLKRELNADNESFLAAALEKVLSQLGDHEGRATLFLHSSTLEAAQALAEDTRLQIKIKTDDTLIAGGFILDSQGFYVDGSVESRLNEILKSLDQAEH